MEIFKSFFKKHGKGEKDEFGFGFDDDFFKDDFGMGGFGNFEKMDFGNFDGFGQGTSV